MWGRFRHYDSDHCVGQQGSSHHRDLPRPHKTGGQRRESAPTEGNQVASWRVPGSANQAESKRRSADHRLAPCPSPPSSAPTHLEVLDFHGKTPPIYPHWCSLCDVTVMSEKVRHTGQSFRYFVAMSEKSTHYPPIMQVWLQHVNGTPHADGQLQLLQR